jgi:6-phosphogluconolactonase (cycloisomerase 2 family)
MKLQFKNATGALVSLLLLLAGCRKDSNPSISPQPEANQQETANSESNVGGHHPDARGHVYTITNDAAGNKVLDYRRSANGMLSFESEYDAGGMGSGDGLGNQGSVVIAKNTGHGNEDNLLLVVNAGSHSISSFRIRNNGLQLRSTVNSGGMRPVSIAQHGDLVYVLNAGGNGNISGFRIKNNGRLEAIPGSTRSLSVASTTAPAQISFVWGGRVLVITEKATNTITTYTINHYGLPGIRHTRLSSSPTPFGFATGRLGNIFVSEAVGGAPGASVLSSYRIQLNGSISLVNGSVGAGQSAACWVVITKDGKFAYATNTASNTISTFNVNVFNGALTVGQAVSATTDAGPIDAAISNNSRFLYVLNGGAHSLQAFSIALNGTLNTVQTVTGLPASANGLAAD